jgi:hypothetical protein
MQKKISVKFVRNCMNGNKGSVLKNESLVTFAESSRTCSKSSVESPKFFGERVCRSVKHDNRFVGVQRVEREMEGDIGYTTHTSVSQDRGDVETREPVRQALGEKNPPPRNEWDAALRHKGVFVLVSSGKIEPDKRMKNAAKFLDINRPDERPTASMWSKNRRE